jgi:hypothetical protein
MCRRAAFYVDAEHVAERMHAGVGSTRHGEVGIAGKHSKSVPHHSFDRPQARLRRPPMEMGAVVLER